MTNVLKHAGPATARVNVRHCGGVLEVEVWDDGRGAAADPRPGTGHGHVGMRERWSCSPRGCPTPGSDADCSWGEATVKTQVARILTKLGVRGRVQAVIVAFRAGVVPKSTPRPPSRVTPG